MAAIETSGSDAWDRDTRLIGRAAPVSKDARSLAGVPTPTSLADEAGRDARPADPFAVTAPRALMPDVPPLCHFGPGPVMSTRFDVTSINIEYAAIRKFRRREIAPGPHPREMQ